MRPAGRGPLDSLYFAYPHFEPPALSAADKARRHRVAIVGAGPVGMTAALVLAQYGIPSVLLDAKSTFNDGSRAICIARQSFQILQQIGAVAPFLDKALGWRHGSSFYRGQPIFRLTMPHAESEKYLPMYNIEQQFTEAYLWAAIEREPLIETRWQSAVTGLDNRVDGVTLTVEAGGETYALEAEYVLAADGARSPIRQALDLRLKGRNYEGRYIIADVKMAHDYPTERRALFSPLSNAGGTVLIHKQPDDIWRIDYRLPEGETEEEALREESIRARVQAILGDIGHEGPWELEWWSIYSANTLCLDDYRAGRVLFIGDSAHIVPIFGVRGLNNGFADAQNAGWKLAYVLNGAADEALLDSYSPERRGATLDVFANATKSTRFMTPPSRGWSLVREAALSLALTEDFTRDFANPRQMTPYTYADSPLTPAFVEDGAFVGGPVSGAACLNARLPEGGYLLDRTGKGFSALIFVDHSFSSEEAEIIATLEKLDPYFKGLILPIGDPAYAEVKAVFDAEPGTAYLLRPDQHVAGRWRHASAQTLASTLKTCLGRA